MAMSRKTYEAVAAEFRTQYAVNFNAFDRAGDLAVADGALNAMVDRLASIFENDNPNFDRARFVRACKEKR